MRVCAGRAMAVRVAGLVTVTGPEHTGSGDTGPGREEPGAYARALARNVEHDAIRAAEAVVGAAWACRLEQVRNDSEVELLGHTQIRDRIRERLERCWAVGDKELIAETEAELAAAELAVVRVATDNALLDGYVTRELRALDQARSARIDASVAEQRLLHAMSHDDTRPSGPDPES